jgi:hypothetical protein
MCARMYTLIFTRLHRHAHHVGTLQVTSHTGGKDWRLYPDSLRA